MNMTSLRIFTTFRTYEPFLGPLNHGERYGLVFTNFLKTNNNNENLVPS